MPRNPLSAFRNWHRYCSEENYLKLIASCRSTIPELRPQVFATTNPDGPGFMWVKKRWNIHGVPNTAIRTIDPITDLPRVFMPARVGDNPKLVENDPGYLRMLDGLPDGLREAWKDGSWDEPNIKGAYYTLALLQARREQRIKHVAFDPTLLVHTIWDLGVGEQLVCLFVQRVSNETRIIDSWQGQGTDGLPTAAAMLQERQVRLHYRYGSHFAPHDVKKTETATGKTIIQTAQSVGIVFQQVPMIGIQDGIMLALMMWPRLIINEPNCEQPISAWRQYRREWDENRLDWKDEPYKDWTNHYSDALRYLAIVEPLLNNYGGNVQYQEFF